MASPGTRRVPLHLDADVEIPISPDTTEGRTALEERAVKSLRGHVGRLVAKNVADVGRLYLAFQTPHSQLQLKALASGSVVDATFPADAEAVILPPLP
jgi:hypothetical protein